jgi:hypothetical protein
MAAPRRGKTISPINHQTGKTNIPRDARINKTALKPGMRISMNNKKYFEGRKNRSDLHGKI